MYVLRSEFQNNSKKLTTITFYSWGSQRRSRSLGFMLNNEMDDFAIPHLESAYGLPPSPANMLAPNLQPLSSMVPSIVRARNGRVDLVLGAAGGTKITTQVALVSLLRTKVELQNFLHQFTKKRKELSLFLLYEL